MACSVPNGEGRNTPLLAVESDNYATAGRADRGNARKSCNDGWLPLKLRPLPPPLTPMSSFLTAAFYKFVELADFRELKAPLLACCEAHGVKGTILLATEGINGTIAGTTEDVHPVLDRKSVV